jgi:hypothetical protein
MGLIVAMRMRVAKLMAAIGAVGRWLRVDPRRSLPVPPYFGVLPAARTSPRRLPKRIPRGTRVRPGPT